MLDYWNQRLLGVDVSGQSRTALLQVLLDDDTAAEGSEFSGDDKDRDTRIGACVGAAGGITGFQYR